MARITRCKLLELDRAISFGFFLFYDARPHYETCRVVCDRRATFVYDSDKPISNYSGVTTERMPLLCKYFFNVKPNKTKNYPFYYMSEQRTSRSSIRPTATPLPRWHSY